MRYQVRIIAGSLRGRKLTLFYHAHLRPLADRAREALFSLLGDSVPDRPFCDVFAGSGAVGIEALSRGASRAVFVERDPQAVKDIIAHLEKFDVEERAQVLRADAYRWADKWNVPKEPANVFLGPPYQEFEKHFDAIVWIVTALQSKLAPESTLVVQSDDRFAAELLPDPDRWDVRHYGRTQLAVWIAPAATGDESPTLEDSRRGVGESLD